MSQIHRHVGLYVLLAFLVLAFTPLVAEAYAGMRPPDDRPSRQALATPPPTPMPVPPPTPPAPARCLPPEPRHYSDGKPHRKILFVSGWGFLEILNGRVRVDAVSGWDSIKQYLMRESQKTGTPLHEEDFLYYSYSGEYECDSQNRKDYTRPKYYVDQTSLGVLADYDARANTFEEILKAFPEDQFDIISHSNGGVVALYWAATRFVSPIPQPIHRVNSIITLDSPLLGWPGICRIGLGWPLTHPSQVINALPQALDSVRVVTIANASDTVVRPETATLPGVRRHRMDYFGAGKLTVDCDWDSHGLVRDHLLVHSEIFAALWPGQILAPTTGEPYSAGDNTRPTPILITVTYPASREAEDKLIRGNTDKVLVRIGDRRADVLHVNVSDISSRPQFRLRVLPPPQPSPGKYDLTVQIGSESSTQKGAVEYQSALSSPASSASSTTVLLFDVSGSMDMPDHSGKSKIEAARDAALRVIRMIGRENDRLGTTHQVGIVTFSDAATILQPLTSQVADAERATGRVAPLGGTNMAAGLTTGARQLKSDGSAGRKIAILLSDGVPTVFLDGRGVTDENELPAVKREVLERAVPEAVADSTCLYVIGLGDPTASGGTEPSIDEEFLREIANAGSCGDYYRAENAADLANVYVRLRHESTGLVAAEQSGTVAKGQTTAPHPITVPANQGELHVTLNWPGSRLDLLLIDPQGRRVDNNYPGASLFTDQPPVYFIVRNPLAGTWQARVYGADVAAASEPYNLVVSTRGSPAPATGPFNWGGLAFIVVLLAAVGAGAWILQSSARGGQATLIVSTTPSRRLRLRASRSVIGRDPRCALVIPDTYVSGEHAQIVRSGSYYTLYDLGSRNGTFVNGERVQQRILRDGDRIQIGAVELVFLQPGGP